MHRHPFRGLLIIALIGGMSGVVAAAEAIDYTRDVKPLLKHCTACHGALRQQSGLRVDTAALLQKGGDSGAAVVPGKSQESLLIHALTGTNDVTRMPPADEADPLSAEAINKIKAWIDQGAKAPAEIEPIGPRQHWAYQRPILPPVPIVAETQWVKNPIDNFILTELEQRGLQHAPEAQRNVLLRRVYLDLIGLPPTPEELQDFLTDDATDAYENVVTRLLNSPRYGERWGRHWMDVWRYSDWAGYGAEIRESQHHIWRWRDWIIESLNADKPYDQMVREMIAGDEIAPTDPDVLRATGYLGRNWFKFNRNVWLDNTVEHCGKAFLGVTFNCARCHDHKYDPVSQSEYFRLRAIFEAYDVRYDRVPGQPDATKDGVARVFDKRLDDPTYLFVRGDEHAPDKEHPQPPKLPEFFETKYAPTAVQLPIESFYPALVGFQVDEARARWNAEIAAAEDALAKARAAADESGKVQRALATKKLVVARAELASFELRLAAEQCKYGLANHADQNQNQKSLARAASHAERQAALDKAEFEVQDAERHLAVTMAAEKPGNEKTLKATADARAKLDALRKALETAKTSLVTETEKYAPLGEVYPQTSTGRRLALAHWITSRDNPLTARVAINHLWLRHFGRPLVSTVFDFGMNGKPPSHPQLLDWLASELMERGWTMKHIHRLVVTSATYRQSSSPTDFATRPTTQLTRDPDNQFLWKMNSRRLEAEIVRDSLLCVAGSLDATYGGPEIDEKQGQQVLRRSIYFRHAKEKEMVFTKLFDGPGVSECYQRDESVVPQQALALANSPLAKNQARLLAGKLSRHHQLDQVDPFITAAFEQVLTRAPATDELLLCRQFLSAQSRLFADPDRLTAASTGDAGAVPAATDPQQRARENLVHVLLNHHDFVTAR